MKLNRILHSILIISCFILVSDVVFAIPNPWSECRDDIYCAARIAGFNFPLQIENYSVRAMKDMIEITFSLDKKRIVTIRKSQFYNGKADNNGIKDISGDYNTYPVNKTILINEAVPFSVRGNINEFYVVNFAAESGYYSIMCEQGLKIKDIKYFYRLLKEAEAPKAGFNETNICTIKLQDFKKVEEIVEPVYTQDCFPRTLQKKGVTEYCFERANLGQDTYCSASEIKMIKKYYKKGQDKDPLNNSSGQFCAN